MSNSSQLLLKTEDTNTFVLNTLFSTLLTASGNQASVADLKLWYSAYLAMVSLKWIFCGICNMHLKTPNKELIPTEVSTGSSEFLVSALYK